MTVDRLAARVVEVLARAESLFADPADAAPASATADAADAARAIPARVAGLSGSAATAHAAAAGAAAQRLDRVARTDTRLAADLAAAGQAHGDGRAKAAQLRAAAAEVPAVLGPLASLPTAEVAGLSALRDRVAAMQRLLAHHSRESARIASQIRNLGYRQ